MKVNKRWRSLAALCLVSLLFLTSVFYVNSFQEPKPVKIVFIPKVEDPSNDFWMSMISGAQSAAKEYQAELFVLAPENENDYFAQIEYIDNAIALQPDVIVLSPIQYSEMTEHVKTITQSGIRLILLDSKLDEEVAVSYVGTDNIAAGIRMGEMVRTSLTPDSKIAIMSHVKGASTAIEREAGIREGLGDQENNIVTVSYSDSDYDRACRLTKEMLIDNPDIDVIIGLNLYSTVGVARAIKEMGLTGQIRVVGFDNDIEAIRYLEDSVIDMLLVQKPFHMGYLGIQSAVKAARGGKIETVVYSDTVIITDDNIFTDENQKLLFPF